ncbi:hypothetical protein AAL_02142 [Moelleriella libera RCEF 2490]|uniref:Uncharacterized protein n=1 Tax=Moelleriella libera RCEF 2490 TaxID=1081109 RepID=A0A166PWT3_9HYPO|nr:hypothetical protein AAL_02142 [Moelleriella libera RCEF 2490]
MQASTTEDSGLTESTYELINASDTESHDENYTESIAESVSSSDFHRPDDVHSLAETHDDESFVDDDAQSIAPDEMTDTQVKDNTSTHHVADTSETEEEARSRCSLEYTQHSLKTPSLLTPEASKILERTSDDVDTPEHAENPTKRTWTELSLNALSRSWYYVARATSAAMPFLLAVVAVSFWIAFLDPSPGHFAAVHNVSILTSTVTATATSTVTCTVPTTSTTMASQQTVSAKGMDLVSVNDDSSDEWLFGFKKPEVLFSPLGPDSILIHTGAKAKRAWLKKKDCISIVASRGTEDVETHYTPADDGFVVKFPKHEMHGLVKLLFRATCRPHVWNSVRVQFGKGIMEEAFEITRNIVHNISGLIPAATHEAERCLVGAKKSIWAASNTVANGAVTISDNLLAQMRLLSKKCPGSLELPQPAFLVKNAREAIGKVPQRLKSVHSRVCSISFGPHLNFEQGLGEEVVDVKLAVIRAQLAANSLWLRVTGRRCESNVYMQKAAVFLQDKERELRHKMRLQQRENEHESRQSSRPSRRCRCMSKHRGKKYQDCNK